MAYFPSNFMPQFPKKDAPGAPVGTILAKDFNRHEDEIIAIENFLGKATQATIEQKQNILNGKSPENISGVITRLVDEINTFVAGIGVSSGYLQSGNLAWMDFVRTNNMAVLSPPAFRNYQLTGQTTSKQPLPQDGQRVIFPSNVTSTFLLKPIGPSDNKITVSSTVGFPDSGYLTILNDQFSSGAGLGLIEYISYVSKTDTQFIGCQRGVLGTSATDHAGVTATTSSTTDALTSNAKDQCRSIFQSDINNPTVCTTRYRIDDGVDVGSKPFIPVFRGLLSLSISIGSIGLDPIFEYGNSKVLSNLIVSNGADGRLWTTVDDEGATFKNRLEQWVLQYQTFTVPTSGTANEFQEA